MKTKRWNIGRHCLLLAKESMIGLGADLRFPKCVIFDGGVETAVRVWSLRMWAGPYIVLIQFNLEKETP